MNPISQYDTRGNSNTRLTLGNTKRSNTGLLYDAASTQSQDASSVQLEMMRRAKPHLGTRLNVMV